MRSLFAFALGAVFLASCASTAIGATLPVPSMPPAATAQSTAAGAPLLVPPTSVSARTSVPAQTEAIRLVITPTPAPTCPAFEPVCILDGHFLLQRPVDPGANNSVDRTYRYGSTQAGTREPHHGAEFANAQGTPVLAVADGLVLFAGDDKTTTLAWLPAYYGNVVVIEHHFPGLTEPVYSLYAHLFKINVKIGQRVSAGEQIGQVGATGAAIGSHLHFEVRVGANDYRSNRNPELWLKPLDGTGVLAGRIQDSNGNLLSARVNIQRMENGLLDPLSVASAETYVTNEARPVRSDDDFTETFAVGELPAGDYRLTLIYNGTIYEQVIKIEAARLTLVKFFVR